MSVYTEPSSSTSGFFQTLPLLEPQFTSPRSASDSRANSPGVSDDVIISRILYQYLPRQAWDHVGSSLHEFSRLVLHPTVLKHAVDAETNTPTLNPLNTFGKENRVDPLWTCEGWRALKAIGIERGVVSTAYDENQKDYNRRIEQFSICHVWSHTSTFTMCPMSMTDGAAILLGRHLGDPEGNQPGQRQVFAETYRRLVSPDPRECYTSGQWMTERSGGSDVSGTETVARQMTDQEIVLDEKAGRSLDGIGQPLGPWVINGFKWFSSATDSDVAVALARTSKAIGAFYIPMRRTSGTLGAPNELNGIRIQRLKNKLGTRGLPTAELELKQARGWLIGEEGKGVKEMSAILNITRLHAAAGNVSFWSRGLSVCRAFTKVRKARGQYLHQNSHHVSWMAAETVKYFAAAHFTFFGIALLGSTEMGFDAVVKNTPSSTLMPRDPAIQRSLLRLLTPVIKAQVTLAGVGGLRECMECLGGVGYCENNDDGGVFNLAKLFRDSVVNTIWEGTRSVMAEDVRRVIGDGRVFGGKIIEQVYAPWVKENVDRYRARFEKECEVVEERLDTLVDLVSESKGSELEYYGRGVLEHLEAITGAVVLLHDGNADNNDVGAHIASRYAWSKAVASSQVKRPKLGWKEESVIDARIFLGDHFSSHDESGSKL